MTFPSDQQRIADLEVQVDWLRQLVDHLYRELRVSPPAYRQPAPPAGPQVDPELHAALAGGNKIEAIKIYRERTGVGLAEAKRAVEELLGER